MSLLETLAHIEHGLRPKIARLSPRLAISVFSKGRTWFAKKLAKERPSLQPVADTTELFAPVQAWGLTFARPLWNAAGMFKHGEAYDVVAAQGAGAYVAGTTTSLPRLGNTRNGIRWPTASYAVSGSASNWMGLPNDGHAAVAARLAKLTRVGGCPVGASVAADPAVADDIALPALVAGMRLYEDARVDYIELNESCPNTEPNDDIEAIAETNAEPHSSLDPNLVRRLEYVKEHFLRSRKRQLPVVVKFSVDVDRNQLDDLLTMLVTLGFDGVVLGNTSTAYDDVRHDMEPEDLPTFDYFIKEFGGGVSGRTLKYRSLFLAATARDVLRQIDPQHEFHIIRCGGIETLDDIRQSQRHDIQLNQWYTGYYDAFGTYGHALYQRLAAETVRPSR